MAIASKDLRNCLTDLHLSFFYKTTVVHFLLHTWQDLETSMSALLFHIVAVAVLHMLTVAMDMLTFRLDKGFMTYANLVAARAGQWAVIGSGMNELPFCCAIEFHLNISSKRMREVV